MTIQYQNHQTGDAYDVTSLVTQAEWSTKRVGSPAKLAISVLSDPAVTWVEGGVLRLFHDDMGLFYGYVFQISVDHLGMTSIVAYDQTRYLKNKDTIKFEGVRADQVLSELAAKYRLVTGDLPNTGYVIPSMPMDGKTLYDMILGALDRTLIFSGRMFYLWDDFGVLRLSEVRPPDRIHRIGEGHIATGYSYDRSIDKETYNVIHLLRDNKETGKRDGYAAYDSNNIKLWGILVNTEKVDESLNPAQIQERCEMMLELYNRPTRALSLDALAVQGLRAGQTIFVDLPNIAVAQTFLVEEVSHDLLKETMQLKVKVV